MKTIGVLILILIASLTISCKSSSVRSDGDINKEVKEKFAMDESLSAADIKVHTKDGVVTLSGKTIGQAEKDRAVDVARTIPGVTNVQSELEVDTHITDSDVKDRVEKAEEAAHEKNEKIEDAKDSNALKDAKITTEVKLKLAEDPDVSALKIDVDTNAGIVTLRGTVKSRAAAAKAVHLAESVDGVKSVKSVLAVKAS
jgi:hyperosmotically inducible periplasmic protein